MMKRTASQAGLPEEERRPVSRAQELELCEAAGRADATAVRRLLDLGVPVDSRDTNGCSALYKACGEDVVNILLENGADPNLKTLGGMTPMLVEAMRGENGGCPRLLEALVRAGADINHRGDNDETPLMYACFSGKHENVRWLVANGADVLARDLEGNNVLHHLAECDREDSESTARALFETRCLAKEREIAKAVKKFVGRDPAQLLSEFAAPRPTFEPNNEGKTPIEIAEGEDELSCANFELAEWIRERTETRH